MTVKKSQTPWNVSVDYGRWRTYSSYQYLDYSQSNTQVLYLHFDRKHMEKLYIFTLTGNIWRNYTASIGKQNDRWKMGTEVTMVFGWTKTYHCNNWHGCVINATQHETQLIHTVFCLGPIDPFWGLVEGPNTGLPICVLLPNDLATADLTLLRYTPRMICATDYIYTHSSPSRVFCVTPIMQRYFL